LRPVGREFGSPDFDRLMEQNFRDGIEMFGPGELTNAEHGRG